MAVDPRLTGAVIIFQPWILLMNFAALTLLPVFELGVERSGCGSVKIPQNLPFVASNFGFRWRIFSLESRVWYGFQDRTGGQGGVWGQGYLPPNIHLSHKTFILATKHCYWPQK
jgi:hypothetical protein